MYKRRKTKGRKDHYTPRGYLRGFIAPSRLNCERPLWHLDLSTCQWSEKSPAEVGWERGFYDYAGDPPGRESLDATFARFEREFPIIRDRLIQRHFKDWVKQRPFLLAYMQMMRARSPLFFEHQTAEFRNLRGARITRVGPGNQVQVDSLERRPFPEHAIRNGVITKMRQEIEKGPDWLEKFNWCLRYTNSPENPFVTGDQVWTIVGPAPNLESALQDPGTLIFFPFSWQACLIGGLDRFEVGTDVASPEVLILERSLFRRPQNGFLISPYQLSEDAFGTYAELKAGPLKAAPSSPLSSMRSDDQSHEGGQV